MFKKIIAAGTMLALFACSSVDEDNGSSSSNGGSDISSSSQQGNDGDISSSSVPSGPSIVPVDIALNGEQLSILLKTYYYTYTLKSSAPEDLTQYWDVANCPIAAQAKAPPAACQLDTVNTMVQHKLTTKDAPLHYDKELIRIDELTRAITLKGWNLTGNGDEAALGINAYTDEANIQNLGERGLTDLNNIISFEYTYAATGAHEFRIGTKKEADFWYYEVPATASEITLTPRPPASEYRTITIPIKDLKGMGSLVQTPFDISKAAKFLWAVQYKGSAANNKGSLILYEFRAYVER
jgi:hypothetical protein